MELRERKPKSVEYIAPDGGWGWMVAGGTYLNTFFLGIVLNTFSILYVKILKENNTSTTTTAWIFNLTQFNWNLATIFLPALCDEFGFRKVTFAAGCLVAFSSIGSGFIKQPEYLFLTTSCLYGIGAGIGITIFHLIIPKYFNKRRGRVIGLINSAFSLGQFVIPVVTRRLQDAYGNQGAIFILGALMLNICVGAMLYHPIHWHWKKVQITQQSNEIQITVDPPDPPLSNSPMLSTQNEVQELHISTLSFCSIGGLPIDLPQNAENRNKKLHNIIKKVLTDLSTLKSARVVLLSVSLCLNCRLLINMSMFTPLAVMDKGHGLDFAAYCLSTQGICKLITAPIVASLTDFLPIRSKYYFMAGCLICSCSLFVVSITNKKIWILVSMGIFGIGDGATMCLMTQLIIESVGLENLPSTIGAYGMVSLFFCPIVGPILGFLRDLLQDYNLCLKIVSGLQLVPLLLWLMMPLAKKYDLQLKTN